MLDQNVYRLMILIGGVIVCAGVFMLLKGEYPVIQETFQNFFSQRITKY
ncbi:hypothetical protein MC28_D114 (plasmid) [Bacillus thuringiensis MC28]|nr:hypothetical protein MC28_D114 [Bacillus thuringiensis MC28]EJR50077.1 hypothetical protein IIO_06390 [Bacillus cereus VD115]